MLFFSATRILHGMLSAFLTFILIKVFDIAVPTFTNGRKFSFESLYSTPALAVSMVAMSIIFIISLTGKKYNGKILEDIV